MKPQPFPIAYLARAATAIPLLLAGCGGSGDSGPVATTGTAAPAAGSTPPAAATTRAEQVPAQSVTPNRKIDPKAVVDVVEAEVKGGEASMGPSPEGIYWSFPDTSKIQDEPLVVEVPAGLPELTLGQFVPANNPITKGKFELGRQLYFDPRISKNGTVSCATCHNPGEGWDDGMPTSVGIDGQIGGRNAPTVINTVYGRTMFWDGRAPSLEGQAQGPVQNKIEMGDQSYEQIVNRLREIPGYREQFLKVFGTDVNLDGMAKAIATFERVASLSGNSKFDRYRAGDQAALSEAEKRGMVLFGERPNPDDDYQETASLQKAKCSLCHQGFNFSDERFHNLGVGWDESAGKFKDPGRMAVAAIGAKDLKDLGAFKTPTLRDIEKTAPYMHDGSEATLEAVIAYYDRGGNKNPYLDKDMVPLNLTDAEKADLATFLKALAGEARVVELPQLPPGPDGSAPDPKGALEPPIKKTAQRADLHGLFARD